MPALWDRVTHRIVTNDYPVLTTIIEDAFADGRCRPTRRVRRAGGRGRRQAARRGA